MIPAMLAGALGFKCIIHEADVDSIKWQHGVQAEFFRYRMRVVVIKAALKTHALQTLRDFHALACRAPASGVRASSAPLYSRWLTVT
jgi:hypothetical protein